MPGSQSTARETGDKTWLDRSLSPFADVKAGEGLTALLMMVNIFLLLVCYSVIKTVREPLILLGGGAEVRSYSAAGQALVLMAFIPFYSWFVSRVDRVKLLVGIALFFVIDIELFALAVAAEVPYVGVAFFIWVGVFNMSVVAQFWSYANDIYTKEAGDRLFPIIVIGMTAGAPLGALIAGRLFAFEFTPQVILQISAVLLVVNLLLYLRIDAVVTRNARSPREALPRGGGFGLILGSSYLRLVAVLIVLLNLVNQNGEYVIAHLLTNHASALAAATPGFNKQAYLGAFAGSYQFWVNVGAFTLQAFVASRLVKSAGLRGVLLALPLIALGGYSVIALGVGFAAVRWIKTAENATDYSIMNTARQLLWLPTSREAKYKGKQAIDTFFVRIGDLLSAGIVFIGTTGMRLDAAGFAAVNVALTLVWISIALLVLKRHAALTRSLAPAAAMLIVVVLGVCAPARSAFAQQTREDARAAAQAEKAKDLHPYVPDALEQRIARVEQMFLNQPPVYAFIGSVFPGGWLAVGPGYRTRFADTGAFDAHAAWSIRNYKAADGVLRLPEIAGGRVTVETHFNWLDAPSVAFYGVGNDSRKDDKVSFLYRSTTTGASARVQPVRLLAFGGGVDGLHIESGSGRRGRSIESVFTAVDTAGLRTDPTYLRSHVFAEIDWRDSPGYTRRGGLYRVQWSDYHETTLGRHSFRRVDGEIDEFLPILRENWVIALRALVSSTTTSAGNDVPYFLMPELGGSRQLRGYPSWRFRDRNRLLLTGEYRWMAGQYVDMALFFDAGRVAAAVSDIDLNRLKTSYGIGIRFHTPAATVMRIEVARTREGTSLVFGFGPSF